MSTNWFSTLCAATASLVVICRCLDLLDGATFDSCLERESARFTATMLGSAHIADNHMEGGDKAPQEARWHVRIARGSVSSGYRRYGCVRCDSYYARGIAHANDIKAAIKHSV